MDSQIVTIGNPTTLSVDYLNGEANIYLEKNTADIHTLFEREFRDLGHITVLLSGGIDSQFSAALAKKYASSMHALCFRFVWEGKVINATDIINAQEFAKAQHIDLVFEDFDLSYHYENEQVEYLTHYRVYSPQLSAYISAIKKSNNITGTVLMGGEAPLIVMDGDQPRISGKHYTVNNKLQMFGSLPSLYLSHYAPFAFLDILNGVDIIRDPFLMSPEILYAAYMQNISVMSEYKHAHFTPESGKVNRLQGNAQKYKQMYYSSFGFELLEPLNKRTGFESLRFHLACVTGRYDEYEHRYRLPIKKALATMPWASPKVFTTDDALGRGVIKNQYHGSDGIEEAVVHAVKDIDLSPTNYYILDW